jgi:YcxB-like protein
MIKSLELNSQLDLKDIFQYNLFNLYRNPMIIFVTIIGVIMLILASLYYLGIFPYFESPPIFQLLLGSVFTIGLPLFTFLGAKRNINSKGRITEKMVYKLDNEWIELIGESFESKFTWEKLHKFRESKSLFILYAQKNFAYLISKKSLSANEITEMRELVRSVPNLDYKIQSK